MKNAACGAEISSPLLQLYAAKQILKTLAGAQRVQFRIDFQKIQEEGPLRVTLLEFGERLISITESGIDGGESVT